MSVIHYGLFLIFVVVIVTAIHGEVASRQKRIMNLINELSLGENRELLMKNLTELEITDKKQYLYLLITPFTIGLILWYPFVSQDAGLILTCVLIVLIAMHIFFAIIAILILYNENYGKPSKMGLEIADFVTDEELFLLFTAKNGDMTGEWDTEIMEANILSPDELIPFIQNKTKIKEYIDIQNHMKAVTDGKEDLLTDEQIQRNKLVFQEFIKIIEPLQVHLQEFENATSTEHHIKLQKEKLNKQEIHEQFDSVHREIEKKLMEMNQEVRFEPTSEEREVRLPKAIQELKRVTQAKQVSVDIKSQASDLIDLIIEKEVREKSNHEKEMLELDALSVIEASKLFYGIQDDHQGR